MRKIFILFLIWAISGPLMAKNERQKKLSLASQSITKLVIECGAGFLKIEGQPDAQEITVLAELEPENVSWSHVKKVVTLKLYQQGNEAKLISKIHDRSLIRWLFEPEDLKINLTVTVPEDLNLEINDGAGDITINQTKGMLELVDGSGDIYLQKMRGQVKLNDGSGDISIKWLAGNLNIDDGSGDIVIFKNKGNVKIDDGSGKINAKQIDGKVTIEDGSGGIELSEVTGQVKIDDSSGNIVVTQVGDDLAIEDSSGDIKVTNIDGNVQIDDGSGDINVQRVTGDLTILDDSSGALFTKDIAGKIVTNSD